MEQAKEKLKADIALLEKAIASMNEVLKEPTSDIVRDATIQRFEYSFELAWKTIKVAADYAGTICRSPREAIKTAFQMEWIEDADSWFEAMEARNQTSHTYNINYAKEVYEQAKKFPALAQGLIAILKNL